MTNRDGQSPRVRVSGRVLLFGGPNVACQELLANLTDQEVDSRNHSSFGDVTVPLARETIYLRITAIEEQEEINASMQELASFLQFAHQEPSAPALIVLCVKLPTVYMEDEEVAVEELSRMKAEISNAARNREITVAALVLHEHSTPFQYSSLRERHEALPEMGFVASGTPESLHSALERCMTALRLRRVSDALPPLSGELEALLDKKHLILNTLLPGDLSSVLMDQCEAATRQNSALLSSYWEEDRLKKFISRILAYDSSLTDVPFSDDEARACLTAINAQFVVRMPFVGMSLDLSPPHIQRRPSVDALGAVGAQLGRWTSYIPNGFAVNAESSRDLLQALSMLLARPLPVALRLHSLSIHDVTDLGLYCIRNSISDGSREEYEALCGLSSLLAADPEDEPTLRPFILHAITMVREALEKQSVPQSPHIRTSAEASDAVPSQASIAVKAQRWCHNVKSIITTMNLPFVKREAECALLLLSLVSGENAFIHGPPGVAKSMLARRLFSFYEANEGKGDNRDFKIVLSRTTLPDELFGPVSLTAAKQDRFERNVTGHLPTAMLAFIDEVFNASSAVLNGLLSIINERVYRNGTKEVKVPLHMVVGASTDFPSAALKPFFDRFLIRMHIPRLSSDKEWGDLLEKRCRDPEASADPVVTAGERVTDEILTYIRSCSAMAEVTPRVRHFLTILPRALSSACRNGGARMVDLSERRFFHAIGVLQTAATVRALAGLSTACVTILDCALLQHMLWDDPKDIPAVHSALIAALKETMMTVNGGLSFGTEDKNALQQWWDLNPWKAAVAGQFGEFLRELIHGKQ